MRHQHGIVFQENPFAYVTVQTLRLATDGCFWLGQAFLGFSFILLCKVRKSKSAGDSGEGESGLLLSGYGWGIGESMREIKIMCPGCKRLVEALFPIANTRRCEDCTQIAERNGIQFDKAALN